MNVPYHIERIFQEKKITDLLSDRGILPAREYAGKKFYNCPLHSGDKDPSFVVYTDSTYENYICYGCKSGGNVINLLSAIDKMSIKKAASLLLDGIEISDEVELKFIIKGMEEFALEDRDKKLLEILLKINVFCYTYIQGTNFDSEEIEFVDELFHRVDKAAISRDVKCLEEMYDILESGFRDRALKLLNKEDGPFVG